MFMNKNKNTLTFLLHNVLIEEWWQLSNVEFYLAQPDHDPNTQHCLCGADADLIMLGLATHEPNFTIIREEFKPNQPKPCEICAQIGKTKNI